MGWKVFYDFLLCCLHVPPGVDFSFDIDSLGYTLPYHVNIFCFFFAIARWSFLLRYFKTTARVNLCPKALAVSRLQDVKTSSVIFIYKDLMHASPLSTLGVMISVTIFVLAYMHRLAERSFPGASIVDHRLDGPDDFTNSLWFIVVTMFTVGFDTVYSDPNPNPIPSPSPNGILPFPRLWRYVH